MSQHTHNDVNALGEAVKNRVGRGCLDKVYKNALLIIILLVVGVVVFSLARSAVYKIRPYERGLHLRGGAFVGIDQPGWHVQIPFVDTVIGVTVIERSGMIEQLAAMTADDVTWTFPCSIRIEWLTLCGINLKCWTQKQLLPALSRARSGMWSIPTRWTR